MISTRNMLAALALSVAPMAASADLIYQPVNPAFGGFPGNFDFLIGTANIQNQFTRSGGGGGQASPPVINFPPIEIDIGGIGGGGGDGDGETEETELAGQEFAVGN